MKSEEFTSTTDTKKQAQVPATMSQKLSWLKSLLRDETLSAKSKNIATALFMCHNENSGRCNPSQAHLAEATGMYRTAVNVALKELLDAGWVGRQKTRTTSLYRLEIAKAEVEAVSEISGERNIMMSGPPEIPLSGNRYIALSAGPDREPSREPSKRTIKLNPTPAEPVGLGGVDDILPGAIEGLAHVDPALLEGIDEAGLAWLAEDAPAEVQTLPETTPPATIDDAEMGEDVKFGGLTIPAATWRTWETTFTHLDLRATVLSRSRWACTVPEERRIAALQTVLGKFNTEERNAALERKATAEAKASAPPPPPPKSRFQI